MRLFCLPHAGGFAGSFAGWSRRRNLRIQICPVEYPGHGARSSEPLCTVLDDLTNALLPDVLPHLGSPYAFFGHSFGALVAYELTHRLLKARERLPAHLFASGAPPPHVPRAEIIHNLPDAQFLAKIREYEGMPVELDDDAELLALLLPPLRADLTVIEQAPVRAASPLPVPITALGGFGDRKVTPMDIAGWRGCTSKSFRCRFFEGGHFFPFERSFRVEQIQSDLEFELGPLPAKAASHG